TSTKVPSEKIKRFGFPPSELGATAAPTKGEMTPVLERRLGNWDLTTTIKPILGKETKIVTSETVVKTYDGTFLRLDSGTEEEGTELVELVTYDPARKAYRMWTYNAQGTVIEWLGNWDEKE